MSSKGLALRYAAGGSLLSLSIGVGAASAQTSLPAALPPAVQQTDNTAADALEEIVVTAERRETTVQKTAASVEVVNSATLQRQQIIEFTDLNSVLVNTQIVPVVGKTQITIRGIGSDFIDPRADPGVAASVNGLFFDRPLPLGFSFLDVARVEVLEGPQGTLYGRNAAAGAINVITNQPNDKFGGMVKASVGNLDAKDVTAVLNVPVTDQLAIRGAYDRSRRDGYIGDYYDDLDTDTARLSARWTPTERLTVYAQADYVHVGGHGGFSEAYRCPGSSAWSLYMPPTCAVLPPGGNAPKTGREGTFVNADQLQLDYSLGWATLTSITGFVGTHERYYDLPDGTYFTQTNHADNYDYSEEIRLAGHDSAAHQGGLAWQGGAYLFDSHGNYSSRDQAATVFPPTGTTIFSKIPQSSEAGYGQVTYGLTNQLRLTGGLRYTHDSKGIDYISENFLGETFGTTKTSGSKWTYKIGAEYDLASDKLLYGTISTGYVAGGVNGGSPSVPLTPKEAPAIFQPETITAYEIGSKNRFLENRLQINGDFYYYDFKNYQNIYPAFVQGAVATGLQVQNAAAVTSYGVELSVDFAVTPNDRLSAAVSWTHATFGAITLAGFIPPVTPTLTTLPAGSPLVNDPDWSGLAGYEHTWWLQQGRSMTFSVNSKLSSSYRLVIGSSEADDQQKGYVMTDASTAYHWGDDKYELRLWVKNLENVPVNVYGQARAFHLYAIEPPRTYGATITAKF